MSIVQMMDSYYLSKSTNRIVKKLFSESDLSISDIVDLSNKGNFTFTEVCEFCRYISLPFSKFEEVIKQLNRG